MTWPRPRHCRVRTMSHASDKTVPDRLKQQIFVWTTEIVGLEQTYPIFSSTVCSKDETHSMARVSFQEASF
jgi:hypothetical protein